MQNLIAYLINFMNTLSLVFKWLAVSSKDPKRVSLMVKGILTATITYLGLASGIFNFDFPTDQAQSIADNVVFFVNILFTLISYGIAAYSAWATVWGSIRKFYRTITGTNEALK
jgi:hypothetical protein